MAFVTVIALAMVDAGVCVCSRLASAVAFAHWHPYCPHLKLRDVSELPLSSLALDEKGLRFSRRGCCKTERRQSAMVGPARTDGRVAGGGSE